MRRDTTEFRNRFLKWKNGELVYENGLVSASYRDGKEVNNTSGVGQTSYLKSLYNTVSNALDFIPIVGAANRFIRNEKNDALFNLASDAIMPTVPNLIVKGAYHGNERLKKSLAHGAWSAQFSSTVPEAFDTFLQNTKRYYNDKPIQIISGPDPGLGFLLNDHLQKDFMESLGYRKTTDEDGIKMIEKATNALTKHRLGRKPNIYQIGEDEIPRDSVIPIEADSVPDGFRYSAKDLLYNANEHPTVFYKSKNQQNPKYYYRDIDLNDYGTYLESKGTSYDGLQILSSIYDFFGNPFILKSGIKELKGFKHGKENNISDSLYISIMERVAKENNPIWNLLRRKNGGVPLSVDEELRRILNDNSYDYRGYYNKYPNSAANADTHWTDEFKTAYHPTFSVYSKYSGLKSQYNPEGILGGLWNGDEYIPAWGLKLPQDILNLYLYKYGKESGIHIKPSHRGRLTALKKRTGKSEAELYKNGSAAVRKMITFARNARKWKH